MHTMIRVSSSTSNSFINCSLIYRVDRCPQKTRAYTHDRVPISTPFLLRLSPFTYTLESKDKMHCPPEAIISPDQIRNVSSLPFSSITKDVLLLNEVFAHPTLLE